MLYFKIEIVSFLDAGFGEPDEKLEVDEEGGGWDVGDDDLELPPDLVRTILFNSFGQVLFP